MAKSDSELLHMALMMLSDEYETLVTKETIEGMHEYFYSHCKMCGNEYDSDYLKNWGMCMSCYAWTVGADGVPCKEPDTKQSKVDRCNYAKQLQDKLL